LTHAWVVLGRPGIGKRQFVACAAAAWLCASPDARGLACGRCDSCRMLAAGGHPDAHLLGTDGHVGLSANARLSREDSLVHWEPAKDSKRREIAVEGVRSLIEKLSVVSHRGGARIVAITPAEALNEASANALLKLIEEPPTGCQLFLIAEQAASLKPTLLSRCQRLLLPLPAPPDAEAWLRQQRPDAAADDCAAALRLSRGAPLAAAEALDAGLLQRQREWTALVAELAAGRCDPLQAATRVGKEHAADFTAWLLTALGGWLRRQTGAAADAGLPELPIGAGAAAKAERLIDATLDTLRALERNANPQLALEALLIALQYVVVRRPEIA
jgi:DNA polymerase-3 subunit delta'